MTSILTPEPSLSSLLPLRPRPAEGSDRWDETLIGWTRGETQSDGVHEQTCWTAPGESEITAITKINYITFVRSWGGYPIGESIHIYSLGRQSDRQPEPSVTKKASKRNDEHHDRARDKPREPNRTLELTRASRIKPRPVIWLWEGRVALGTLGLIAGREGIGKSTCAYKIAASVTRGDLPGANHGTPKGVLIAATEDSWEHTIVPRLIVAGADLDRIYRIEVRTADDIHVGLSLPHDLSALEKAAEYADAALLLLDPLMSRLGDLDTHKDAEVRQALEPLVAIADKTHMAILGLIHHNKSGSADPLQLVMGSKAFTAVARSVHTVLIDPDDETEARRLFGTPKNNLGRSDLPTLSFTIESAAVETDEGTAWTGRLVWGNEMPETIGSVMSRAQDVDKSATTEATEWLYDLLAMNGQMASAEVKRAAQKEKHSADALKRACKRLGVVIRSEGFPRRTYWYLPGPQSEQQSEQSPWGDTLTTPTAPTDSQSVQSAQLVQSVHTPRASAPTRGSLATDEAVML